MEKAKVVITETIEMEHIRGIITPDQVLENMDYNFTPSDHHADCVTITETEITDWQTIKVNDESTET